MGGIGSTSPRFDGCCDGRPSKHRSASGVGWRQVIRLFWRSQVVHGFAACDLCHWWPDSGMESHEWFEQTDAGKVYYRANYLGIRWTIMTTTEKRNPTWTDLKPPPEAVWRALRDIVWKKYQRKRCPWERVADIDKILGDAPPPR